MAWSRAALSAEALGSFCQIFLSTTGQVYAGWIGFVLPNRTHKAARRRLYVIKSVASDHAKRNGGLLFLRRAKKPTPRKPSSSIAHVDGSGIAETETDKLPLLS
jgi:hypothetical protein